MATKPSIQRVHIWDDPESKINFLETTLADKEWEAIIYEPVENNSHGRLPTLQKKFEEQGYKTTIGKDPNGIPTLKLTHFSHETGLLKLVQELGFVKGIRETFSTSGQRLGDILTSTKKTIDFFMGSEGRRFSTLYAFGDVALGSIPSRLKKLVGLEKDEVYHNQNLANLKSKTKRAETLFDLAYDLAFLQSIIMMFGLKEGKEQIRDEVLQGLKAAKEKGADLTDFESWMGEIKDRRSSAMRWFNDKAIFLGPGAQILGQLLLIGAGLDRLNQTRKFVNENPTIQLYDGTDLNGQMRKANIGAVGDILTGSLSVVGWTLMGFFKEQTIENKAEWNEDFFKRLGQEIKESPNRLASICVTLASLIGMQAGHLKNSVEDALRDQQDWDKINNTLNQALPFGTAGVDISSATTALHTGTFQRTTRNVEQGQKIDPDHYLNLANTKKGISKQTLGNGIYLIGDATVALTRNRDYDSSQIANTEAMAEVALTMLDNMPVAFSPESRKLFVEKLSHYLAARLENLHDPKRPLPEDMKNLTPEERISLYQNLIRNDIRTRLTEQTNKYDNIVERAAEVVLRFGSDQHQEVTQKLASVLAESQFIDTTKEEIEKCISEAVEQRIGAFRPRGIQLTRAILAPDIKKPLMMLVQAIPGEQTAPEAIKLYDSLSPFISRHKAHDAESFGQSIVAQQNAGHQRINNTISVPSLTM